MSNQIPLTAVTLTAAVTLLTTGCGTNEETTTPPSEPTSTLQPVEADEEPEPEEVSPQTSTQEPEADTDADPMAVFRELTRGEPPEEQPVLIVHPECRNQAHVWVDGQLWRGPWPSITGNAWPLDWRQRGTIPGIVEITNAGNSEGIITGDFTADDGTIITITPDGAIDDACLLWE